jgi:glycerol uptake facilitator-like aquaporin
MTRRLAAEFVATAFLVAVVIGSGIAGERLSDSTGLTLLINSLATGAGLVALILAFGPASGAHMNPVVTLADAALGGQNRVEAVEYATVQVAGGAVGAVIANLMFAEPAVAISSTERLEPGLLLAEVVATFGLVAVVLSCARSGTPATSVAFAVGAYIASAILFTASTSFANPAVTLARVLTDTFAGISPASAAAFVPAQVVGALCAAAFMGYLYPDVPASADRIVVPHDRLQSP